MNLALNESMEMFLPVDKCTRSNDFHMKYKIKETLPPPWLFF